MINFAKWSQRGDTIVEVLIATVVVSSVLVGAFSIANRSSVAIRAAQDRSEALKQASAGVETIKAHPDRAMDLRPDTAYCTNLFPGPATFAKAMDVALLPVANDTDAFYVGVPCKSTVTEVGYYTTITRMGNTSSFEIHTRWDRVGGGERQDVTLSYRLDK